MRCAINLPSPECAAQAVSLASEKKRSAARRPRGDGATIYKFDMALPEF